MSDEFDFEELTDNVTEAAIDFAFIPAGASEEQAVLARLKTAEAALLAEFSSLRSRLAEAERERDRLRDQLHDVHATPMAEWASELAAARENVAGTAALLAEAEKRAGAAEAERDRLHEVLANRGTVAAAEERIRALEEGAQEAVDDLDTWEKKGSGSCAPGLVFARLRALLARPAATTAIESIRTAVLHAIATRGNGVFAWPDDSCCSQPWAYNIHCGWVDDWNASGRILYSDKFLTRWIGKDENIQAALDRLAERSATWLAPPSPPESAPKAPKLLRCPGCGAVAARHDKDPSWATCCAPECSRTFPAPKDTP